MIASMRMIAKSPDAGAMAYKYTIGQPFVYPKNSLSFAENLLHMCFAVPCEEYKINRVLADALDKIFILHAITSRTRRPRRCASPVLRRQPVRMHRRRHACLWGPAHGGANEAALNMLYGIGKVENIPDFIRG